MDSCTEVLTEMGINLATLAVKGTATAINTKIKAIKSERDIIKVRTKYDEIINELLSEREEIIRIAQAYKSELERYMISDEDIAHLHKTVEKVLEIFKAMSPETDIETYEQIKELISVDTLKTMQLLGFNYKAAIGEPLTQLCANAIITKMKTSGKKPDKQNVAKKSKK
jgi:hypothetical protein